MSETVLILTGCAGFIGFNYLKELIRSGCVAHYDRIISIDKLSYATQYNKNEYISMCNKFDIFIINEDINYIRTMPINSDSEITVLSFASESHVDRSITNPYEIFTSNVNIPVSLVKLIPLKQIKTYWHISTDETYGDLPLDVTPDNWFSINSPFKPSNPYSASKVAQDAFLMSLQHTFGLNLKIIRMANQFGEHQHPEKMIPASILRVLKGDPIKVYGDGKNLRQWTYVKDTVKIINNLVEEGSESKVIHLADIRNLYDNNYISNKILEEARAINVTASIEYIPDRLGHDRAYALKVDSQIKTWYDTDFDDAFKNTLMFYKERFAHG